MTGGFRPPTPRTYPDPMTSALVLLGLRELQQIFPTIQQNTIYRWNLTSGGRARQLPTPFRIISGTPIWTEEQVMEFVTRKGLDAKIDHATLDAIRASQTPATSEVQTEMVETS